MSVSDQTNPPPALILRFLSKKVISKLEKKKPTHKTALLSPGRATCNSSRSVIL